MVCGRSMEVDVRQKTGTLGGALSSFARARRLVLAGLAGLALAACAQSGIAPQSPQVQTPQAPSGDVIGEGSTTVALLAPVSGPPAGQALRNAAEMAYRDSPGADIRILVKDTGGSAEGAQRAAQEAVSEGAGVIVGPLFSQEVAAVGGVARGAGVPVVGFSTDTNVAARGVYLLSFQVDPEVDRVISYAARQGRRSFAALIPQSSYGSVAEASFQQAVARHGGRVAGIERFSGEADSISQAVGRVAQQGDQIDAIFVPDGGQSLAAVLDALAGADIGGNVKLIGTGVWNDPATLSNPRLQGAWFAGPAPEGFSWFSRRYQETFGDEPARIASLSYDATRLAIELGAAGYSDAALTDANGFAGVDGIFRFRSDGTVERGLAVLEVGSGAASMISSPPQTFQARVAAQ